MASSSNASAKPVTDNSFPNDIKNAPECSVCLEIVLDNVGRSITKLHCGHFFHTDCIGSVFNSKGKMICPNCRQNEEDGNWMLFVDPEYEDPDELQHISGIIDLTSSDDDDDDDEDEDEDDELPLSLDEEELGLHASTEMCYQGVTDMSASWEENFDDAGMFMGSGLLDNHQTLQLDGSLDQIASDGSTRFSTVVVDNDITVGNPTVPENEWIPYFQQQLPLHEDSPPPIVASMLACQIQVTTISSVQVGPVPARYEPPPPYYEQARCELPSLELTLATGASVAAEEYPLPCPYCHGFCQSTSTRRY